MPLTVANKMGQRNKPQPKQPQPKQPQQYQYEDSSDGQSSILTK